MISSFEARFYLYIENLSNIFHFDNDRTNNLLVIINSNHVAKVFEGSFPLSMGIRAKQNLKQFQLITKKDIVDITEISFSDDFTDINPKQGEQVIWLFRRGYSFGLYFDFSFKLNPDNAKKDMALLMQRVIFFDLYNHLDEKIIKTLIENGWFPFIQIVGGEHNNLFSYFKDNQPELIPEWCNKQFTNEKVQSITSKWFSHYIFNERSQPISEGLECFYDGKYAADISSLMPMLEGIANLFTLRTTGKGISYKGSNVSIQIEQLSRKKYNEDSLFFVNHFKKYLELYFYKHNKSSESDEAVRNTVSHGRAKNESFTRENSLKIILTLDQLYYFI